MTQPALTLAILIPSRLKKFTDLATGEEHYFFERAIRSVEGQVCDVAVDVTYIVGVDADAVVPEVLTRRGDVIVARSHERSQAGALNAAIAALGDHHHIAAFLEDDDRWEPAYLSITLSGLKISDFVSTTQLEVDQNDQIIRINDFATPSGWIMPTTTLKHVGRFDPSFKWHLDNEWLGRLSNTKARRCHVVEATAPDTLDTASQVRPWLANILRNGGPNVTIRRHGYYNPLVVRLVHSGSGMAAIASDQTAANQSKAEYARLASIYGRVPW